eukprot:m.197155 g.197155  ORF g.197155 m.197155 type:complete len:278 (-) comp15708_c0_seq8:2790-3623(-)
MGMAASIEHKSEGESEEKLEYASTCMIPTSFIKLKLVKKKSTSHNTRLFTFSTGKTPLNLPTCACILVRGFDAEGKEAIRPYTPVTQGKKTFDLLIKVYENGVVSQYLDKLKIKDLVEFKHIPFNIKIQYPFNKKTITMLCGGTGISPMWQALDKLLTTKGDTTEVVMLFGNRGMEDILMKKELKKAEKKSKGRFKCHHILSSAAKEPIKGYSGLVGRIDKEKIEKLAFPPSADTMVFVCGVPAMYDSLCGPRNEKELPKDSALAELGYTEDMVFKF